jgi:hypothetical protein
MLAAALGLALAATLVPATAQAKNDKHDAANPDACVVDHVLSNPFAAWGDQADYALLPGGNFESGAAGWTLSGGAAVADGNQPFDIGAPGASSLALPQGSSARSGEMCIDETYTSFRFFARNTGSSGAGLKAEVLYYDGKGKLQGTSSRVVADGAWAPSQPLAIAVPFNATGAAPIAFRFTPQGKGGNWTIDDVYVDPYARR